MKTLAIIGGGAAGLAAAGGAAKSSRNARLREDGERLEGVRVVIYEADERVGRSILATGNGRCNFSNSHIEQSRFRNGDFVCEAVVSAEALVDGLGMRKGRSSWRDFGEGVRDFFAGLGLAWREEDEGRLYPQANKASSVLDVLRGACLALGVEERCDMAVDAVDVPADFAADGARDKGSRFTLKMADGSLERADALIVACGGGGARALLPKSFPYAEPVPVLGPLATEVRIARQLDNIRVRGVARLMRDGAEVAGEKGEVLFRKYGLSGIAVFNLSRFARLGDVIELDLLPDVRDCDVDSFAFSRFKALSKTYGQGLTYGAYLRGFVLPQVARVVLKEAGFDEDDACLKGNAPKVMRAFKGLSFTVEGIADARQCQVHRGGFAVESFSPHTMEALGLPGLFAAGEVLDVDAACGGYNLHWAWTSGIVAGCSAVARLAGEDIRSYPMVGQPRGEED